MANTIEEAIKNINVINVEEFHKEAEMDLRRHIKELRKTPRRSFFYYTTAPYVVLEEKIINKYTLDNPKEFLEFVNPLLKEKKYRNYDWLKNTSVGELLIKKDEGIRILFNHTANGHFSLIDFEPGAKNEFAFFRREDSKDVEGIYLMGSKSFNGMHYIMAPELYEILIGSEMTRMRLIEEGRIYFGRS